MSLPSICRIKSKRIYRGRVANLYLDTFRTAQGQLFLRETLRHPPSVVIVPVLSRNRVLLIRQFRHAVAKNIYEIPAGTTEPGEQLLRCAKRELEEETGYWARSWKRLCEFYPAPGISTERMVLYRASGLTKLEKPAKKDRDEYITTEIKTVSQAIQLIYKNRIMDAKSIIGLLWGLQRVKW